MVHYVVLAPRAFEACTATVSTLEAEGLRHCAYRVRGVHVTYCRYRTVCGIRVNTRERRRALRRVPSHAEVMEVGTAVAVGIGFGFGFGFGFPVT